MSYATVLYAVDLDRLKSTIGSSDLSLIEAIHQLDSTQPLEVRQRRLHWLAILEDGSVLLDEQPSSLDAVLAAYRSLDKYDAIHFLSRHAETTKRIFASFSDVTTELKGNAAKLLFHPETMELSEFHAYDESASNCESGEAQISEIVCNLIAGKASGDVASPSMGYALLKLCRVVGRQLDDGDKLGDIAALQLDSRLDTRRDVPGFATDGGFPIISYLTSKEVAKELSRLDKSGVDYPDDPDIDAGRKALVACLREAAASRLAVVSFYY